MSRNLNGNRHHPFLVNIDTYEAASCKRIKYYSQGRIHTLGEGGVMEYRKTISFLLSLVVGRASPKVPPFPSPQKELIATFMLLDPPGLNEILYIAVLCMEWWWWWWWGGGGGGGPVTPRTPPPSPALDLAMIVTV